MQMHARGRPYQGLRAGDRVLPGRPEDWWPMRPRAELWFEHAFRWGCALAGAFYAYVWLWWML